MFEARFSESSTLKKIVDALKDFKEITLECSREGISLKVMDECHVSLADMKLSRSFFEFYQCDNPCLLGIKVETLIRLIKLAPNEKALVLRKSDHLERLVIESDEETETGLKRAADMPLITRDTQNFHVPDQIYDVNVEILTKTYTHMIKDLSAIGEDVRITVSAESIKFESDGDIGRVENVFTKGQGSFHSTLWEFNSRDSQMSSIQQRFAGRFLAGFAKACPLSESAVLSMSSKVPLRLKFPMIEDSYLAYYVAPTLD